MSKKLKIALIVLGSVVALALATHLAVNYLVPFMLHLHGTAVY